MKYFGERIFKSKKINQDSLRAQDQPWKVLAKLSQRLSFLLIGMLVGCTGMSAGLILAYFYSTLGWSFALGFTLINAILIYFFFKTQRQGNQIYHRFMIAVEQRHQVQKNTQIGPESQKILKQYLFKMHGNWVKLIGLIFLLPLFALSMYHYHKTQQNRAMPNDTEESLGRLIQFKKNKIKIQKRLIAQSEDKMRAAQWEFVRQYTQLEQAKNALKFQQNALYQAQRQRYQMEQLHQKINKQAKTTAEKEVLLRQDEQIYAQAKGVVEVSLTLKGEPEAQAEGLLQQEGKLYEAFQTLRIRLDNGLQKAQKALKKEQKHKQILEVKLENQRQVLKTLSELTDNYCHQQQRIQEEIRQLHKIPAKFNLKQAKPKTYD